MAEPGFVRANARGGPSLLDHIGTRLRRARVRAGLTKRELARRMEIPVWHLSRFERGLELVREIQVIQIVRAIREAADARKCSRAITGA